jgi:hypothetical protein
VTYGPRLNVLVIYLILKVHDEYVRVQFNERRILPFAPIDDISHFIFKINDALPILAALLSSSTLPLHLCHLVLLMAIFRTTSFLMLIALTLKLQANKIKEVELERSVRTTTQHVGRIIIQTDMLHKTICVFEFLNC